MKTTVLANHGDIQITQEKNKGTRGVLYIPLGKQHLKNDENVCFIEPETIAEAVSYTHLLNSTHNAVPKSKCSS